MSKCIIVISGRKGSGKDTLANMIAAELWNKHHPGHYKMVVNPRGELKRIFDDIPHVLGDLVDLRTVVGSEEQIKDHSLRIISFATKLKQFAMEVLGLSYESCYGTMAEKERLTHVRWDGLPRGVRVKHSTAKWFKFLFPRNGQMPGREVLQVFGTEVIREWCHDAWSNAGYLAAATAEEDITIIPDCRFKNEVSGRCRVPPHVRVFIIRLLRSPHNDSHVSEHELDDAPKGWFDYVLAQDTSLETMQLFAKNFVSTHWVPSEL